jgi:carbamoyltransferase
LLALGINEDLFDSGVTLCDGGTVLFASNEERYTRRKNEGGFPRHALAAMFAYTGVAPGDIGAVCVAGHATPPFVARAVPPLHDLLFAIKRAKGDTLGKRLLDAAVFATPVSHTTEDSALRRFTRPLLPWTTRRMLPPAMRGVPVHHVEHHTCHAAAAWGLSGFERALCLTADGMGDGLSFTVSRCSLESRIERLWSAPASSSLGMFFEALTEAMGFTPSRDEGKLTGLAANGDPARIGGPSPFRFEGKRLRYDGPHGRAAIKDFRVRMARGETREDLSAWAQDILEQSVLSVARHWLAETGESRLVLAGGIFANVKLNQRLHELDGVESVFVCPNMGDGGLGLGAIYQTLRLPPARLRDVFWGEAYAASDIERALADSGLAYTREDRIHEAVAARLAEGRLVARFCGRMEWGPRALGNRSILADASDTAVVARLNALLRRNDFMPFAPAMLDEEADGLLLDWQPGAHAAEFMTVCFRCSEAMKAGFPAVVHTDGTARAQWVAEASNPAFHGLLQAYKRCSGRGVLLNTSFNIHEEPIVRTPAEAVAAFLKSRLDFLAIEDYLVPQPVEQK